jgi:pimeloyl-ACP methyl ester carboxylesterase
MKALRHVTTRAALALAVGLLAFGLLGFTPPAHAQDHEREARWAKETLSTLVAGDAVYVTQKNGNRVLGLYTKAKQPRGAVIIAHGRGWAPDYDLYGELRLKLADAGYSTLSLQMPVLPSTAKLGDYIPLYPDAVERFTLATQWLERTMAQEGLPEGSRQIAVIGHSLGATMANHYFIGVPSPAPSVKAWVFLAIINGLEDMFRVKVPVLDIYAERDWDVTRVGAGERLAQMKRIPGSEQVVIADTEHFFEGKRDELTRVIARFLDSRFKAP